MRLFLKVSPFFALVPLVRSDLCFILYQMADNDLEYFIRQDLEEYSQSPMIAKDETTTWVYFDHRNFGTDKDIDETISFVYNSDGSGRGGPKPEGSFYYTYNHNLSKLVVDSELGELNSDIPQTVYDFATKALGDCKSKGSDEFMFAFSSHGGGHDGFGGDENQRRQLAQSNQNIVQGLRKALDDHSIQKFDMVGFDACLMMAFGALDEFKAVANFFIASEEVEPGHGWSYSNLQGGTAMDTAKEILNSFIDDKQGDEHRTPKTLAIVDTSKYESFSTKWNDFSKELVALMKNNDAEVATALSRARKSAYDFGSIYDGANAKDKASIDMMSFLVKFRNICKPKDNTQLATLLESVKTEYDKMFVERRTGPGTPTSLTGMHIFWPSRKRYSSGDFDWDKILMNDAVTATTSAPEWINLLKAYYTVKTPSASGNTVCSISTGGSDSDENGDSIGLMMDSLISGSPNDGMEFATNISRSVDDVFVEYGADLTPLLEMTRRLSRSHKGQETMDHPRYPNRRRQMQSRRRRLQDEFKGGDYFYISGGDLVGAFEGNTYTTFWDGNFFGVIDFLSGLDSEIYVFDYGEGAKEFPVIYFPPKKRIATEDLLNIVSYEDALNAGAELGYVTFNTNMDISTGLALYTIADSSSESFSELPRSRGGQIVPVNFALASIDGREFDTIFGGLNRTGIIDWNVNSNIKVGSISAVDYLEYFDVENLTFDVVASDDTTGDTSVILLELSATGELLDEFSIHIQIMDDGQMDDSGEPTIAPVESPTVIIDSNCKTENRKLATCYANRPECQTCSKKHPVIKLSSLEKGNPLEKICSEMKEEFKYCGCDACEAEKEAVLECQCDDTNSGSQNILTFWTCFAITLIASIML